MQYFDMYSDLIGLPYDDGDADCYGLCRRYYLKNYQIELPNYARSADFFGAGLDLIEPFLQDSDFKVVDVSPSRLQIGDGLLLHVPNRSTPDGKVNHVGVFVGNGSFLHHLWQKPSCEDYITPQWSRRIMAVVRHPDIAQMTAALFRREPVDFISLLPDHVKHKHGLLAPPVLDSGQGEGGAGT